MKKHWKNCIIPLEAVEKEEIGAKARRLRQAYQGNFTVPRSLCIDAQAFSLLKEINQIEDMQAYDWSRFFLPDEFVAEILQRIKNTFRGRPVVVRSSATCEDSPLLSFAGQYSSFLNLREEQAIVEAIRACYRSIANANARLYSAVSASILEDHAMCILIQELATITHSGVLFTRHPVYDNSCIVIEVTSGLGDKLVAGEIQPDVYEIERERIPLLPSSGMANQLARFGLQVEQFFGYPCDIEWGWDGKQVILLQVRPITRMPARGERAIDHRQTLLGRGRSASAGIATGTLRYIEDARQLESIGQNDIVYYALPPSNLIFDAIFRSSAIITHGGILSHVAVVAREFGKVCLVDPLDFDAGHFNNQRISIDGFDGSIWFAESNREEN